MKWNNHSDLEGMHAYLSPSGYHWLNYSVSKLKDSYINKLNVEKGTELHAMASMCIKNNFMPDRNANDTISLFVMDSIYGNMSSEVLLYYSPLCFGTADAISFDPQSNRLSIYDLKTGDTKASFSQLDIYAALFCLEYNINPLNLEIEERIYQYNTFEKSYPEPELIEDIMNKIILFDKELNSLKEDLKS